MKISNPPQSPFKKGDNHFRAMMIIYFPLFSKEGLGPSISKTEGEITKNN
jgi:hypothetical protein